MAEAEKFILRPVADDAELESWGRLCARGFSHRVGAADRFYKKYLADPTAHREWTRVVVNSHGNLVGSVRIFDRLWDVDGSPERCAGLGEVCTDPDYRGKGIATMMLVDAVEFCEGSTGAAVSSLHAAAAVIPLYQKFGYRELRVPCAVVKFPAATPDDTGDDVEFVAVNFDKEWDQLQSCHANLNAELAVTGTTVRNEAYWRKWMPYTTAGKLLAAVTTSHDGTRTIQAYACIAQKPEGCKLLDAGLVRGGAPEHLVRVMRHVAREVASDIDDNTLIIPARLFTFLGYTKQVDGEISEAVSDVGWMVRPIKEHGAASKLQAASEAGRFLVWPIDSF